MTDNIDDLALADRQALAELAMQVMDVIDETDADLTVACIVFEHATTDEEGAIEYAWDYRMLTDVSPNYLAGVLRAVVRDVQRSADAADDEDEE